MPAIKKYIFLQQVNLTVFPLKCFWFATLNHFLTLTNLVIFIFRKILFYSSEFFFMKYFFLTSSSILLTSQKYLNFKQIFFKLFDEFSFFYSRITKKEFRGDFKKTYKITWAMYFIYSQNLPRFCFISQNFCLAN